MDLLSVATMTVLILGILYSTVFAFLEFQEERNVEYDTKLTQVVHHEVYNTYVAPLLHQKLTLWGEEEWLIPSHNERPMQQQFLREFYCRMRSALLLNVEEYTEYRRQCTAAMDDHSRWWFVRHKAIRIDCACAAYVVHDLVLEGLNEHIHRLYIA